MKSLTSSPEAWVRLAWPFRSVDTRLRLPPEDATMNTRSFDAANCGEDIPRATRMISPPAVGTR